LRPCIETPPVADQAFVGNVEAGGRVERFSDARRDEAAIRAPERVDDFFDLLAGDAGNGCHFEQRGRAARVALLGAALGQAAEHDFGDATLLIGLQFVPRFVGVVGQCQCESPSGFVIRECEGPAMPIRRGTRSTVALPHPHQDVLHQRQLVRIGAHVVEKAIHERRLQIGIEHPGWADHRHLPLLAGQPRRQVLALVHRLR
jgi:hypothetical protein